MSFGRAIINGNLVRDCELKYSQSGKAVLMNAVAFERYIASSQQRETSFIGIIAFGKTAESIQRYFSKGSPIIIDGDLELIGWTDKAGQKHSKIRVIVNSFDFCGSPQRQQHETQQPLDLNNPPF